ncbi:hypothetical protein BG261_02375 [Floricoccus tropicus]|uniref:N-acetyltransferase domain-containing protein n=2 Tax=Floricoccus tropicus TaxID=1859473 RepID=A0A1E8GP96_9LACT|nr:hypothetical protein BG261_02375 [Floricoccus tropicus]
MKKIIKIKIEDYLMNEYNCSQEQLSGDNLFFTIKTDVENSFVKIFAYNNSLGVCSSEVLSPKLNEILEGKSRDEIFELPLVYGQTIHYVPSDCFNDSQIKTDLGMKFNYQFFIGKEIQLLQAISGFDNSLSFDSKGDTDTKAVYIIKDKGEVVAVAGAAETCIDGFWEVGIDVLEKYRKFHLGTELVSRLTQELLKRRIVPFYSASVTNIASQRLAIRAGYVPVWVDTYSNIFDENYIYTDMLKNSL